MTGSLFTIPLYYHTILSSTTVLSFYGTKEVHQPNRNPNRMRYCCRGSLSPGYSGINEIYMETVDVKESDRNLGKTSGTVQITLQ